MYNVETQYAVQLLHSKSITKQSSRIITSIRNYHFNQLTQLTSHAACSVVDTILPCPLQVVNKHCPHSDTTKIKLLSPQQQRR